MAIVSTENSQASMVDSRFKAAAFMSFSLVILGLPMLIINFFAASKQSVALMFFIQIPIAIVLSVFVIYILRQLKRLLVERHHLHNMSNLINLLLIINIYIYASVILILILKIFAQDPDAFGSLDAILTIPGIILVGIILLIFGVRLLNVKDLTLDLYRTFAIISIIDGVCKFTIVLLPIAILSTGAFYVILGIMFLKESETETQVEFV